MLLLYANNANSGAESGGGRGFLTGGNENSKVIDIRDERKYKTMQDSEKVGY